MTDIPFRSLFDAEYVLYFAHVSDIRDLDFQQDGLNIVVSYDLIGEEGGGAATAVLLQRRRGL